MQTSAQRKAYRDFRKALIRFGYLPYQESVYVKLLNSHETLAAEVREVDRCSPQDGMVDVLPLSLARFNAMYQLRNRKFDLAFFSDDLLFV